MTQIIIKKAWFKPYNYSIIHNNKTYHVKQFNLSNKNQLTIHSKQIWNIQYGKVDGARYKTISKKLVHLNQFHQLANPLYLLQKRPYKILQYLNESDIIDVSDAKEINGIPLFYSFEQIKEYLNGNV